MDAYGWTGRIGWREGVKGMKGMKGGERLAEGDWKAGPVRRRMETELFRACGLPA